MKEEDNKMDFLAQGLNIVSKGVIAFGSLWTIWGIIVLGAGLKDHNGQDIRNGLLQAVGGALVIAAGAWITQINVSFA